MCLQIPTYNINFFFYFNQINLKMITKEVLTCPKKQQILLKSAEKLEETHILSE